MTVLFVRRFIDGRELIFGDSRLSVDELLQVMEQTPDVDVIEEVIWLPDAELSD